MHTALHTALNAHGTPYCAVISIDIDINTKKKYRYFSHHYLQLWCPRVCSPGILTLVCYCYLSLILWYLTLIQLHLNLKNCLSVVVWNSVDTIDTVSIRYRWESIRYLCIDTWYCHWNSDQKCQKEKNLKWKQLENRANVEET